MRTNNLSKEASALVNKFLFEAIKDRSEQCFKQYGVQFSWSVGNAGLILGVGKVKEACDDFKKNTPKGDITIMTHEDIISDLSNELLKLGIKNIEAADILPQMIHPER